MIKRYLSPDENAGGDSGTQVQVAPEVKSGPNWSALTEEMFEVDYNPTKVAEEKKVEQKHDEEVKEKSEGLEVKTNTEEKKDGTEAQAETKETEVKEETKENTSDVLELSLENAATENNVADEDSVFINISKELLGVELKENTYESFSEATKTAIKQAEDRGKDWAIQKELAELPPEAQVDFLLLRSGLSRQEIDKPTEVLDKYLSMADIDLVREDLKLSGLPETVVEKEIEILTEKGLVDHEAEKLRAGLKQKREEVLAERVELANRVATEYEANKKAQKAAEIESMNKVFNTVNNFMGLPLKADVGPALAKQYAEGAFDNMLNDPQSKADFILFKQFGENALKIIRNKALEEGREKVSKHLSNIPETPSTNNSKTQVKNSAVTSSGFDKLNKLFPDD